MAGSFVWTLVLTDIASGWTECVPLLVREAGVVVDAVGRLRGALPFPLRADRHRQRQRVPQRRVDRLLQGARHRADVVQAVSEERSGLGRAKERRARPPTGGVWPSGRHARYRSAGPPVLGGVPVRERVPAVVQARRENTGRRGRRPRPQALPRAGDAVCAVARLGHGSRRDEGPSAGAGRDTGSARVAR